MDRIRAKGIKIAYVTLHVGLGTFRPVKVDDVTKHKMHSEHYKVPDETAKLVNKTKKTADRLLQCVQHPAERLKVLRQCTEGEVKRCEGFTDIFIYPGFEFKVLDGLITNFHLPKVHSLCLYPLFAGDDFIINTYKEAVKEKYRLFSFR